MATKNKDFDAVDGGKQMHVTTVEELKSYSDGQIVELPPFAEGQPFVARLRRPSLLLLSKIGKIPNQLLTKAAELFGDGGRKMLSNVNDNTLGDFYDIIHTVVEASLVEPTLAEIEEAGIELSDNQMMAIFNYSQNGVNALKSFRK